MLRDRLKQTQSIQDLIRVWHMSDVNDKVVVKDTMEMFSAVKPEGIRYTAISIPSSTLLLHCTARKCNTGDDNDDGTNNKLIGIIP